MSAQPVRRRPATSSGALAVLVASGVALVLGSGAVRTGLAIELAGLAGIAAGFTVWRRERKRWSLVLAGLGFVGCLVGVVAFLGRAPGPSAAIQSLPAMLGVPVLAAALVPVRGSGSRTLVKLGVGSVFLTVLLAGFFRSATPDVLLGATAASVVAWDAGEQAIGLGEQLGRSATTWQLELVHVGATGLVAVAAVGGVYATRTVATGTPSFAGFTATAVALLLLVVALRP